MGRGWWAAGAGTGRSAVGQEADCPSPSQHGLQGRPPHRRMGLPRSGAIHFSHEKEGHFGETNR